MTHRHTPGRTISAKRAVLLLVVLGGFAGAVYGVNRSMVRGNASAMLRQAKKAEEEGNTSDALRLYVDYLNFQAKDVDALAGYAALLEKTGKNRPKTARLRADTYERLLKIEPHRREERQQLVKLYMAMPFYAAAKDHIDYLLDPARGGTPDDPELLTNSALCELGTGHPKDALERLREAVRTRRASNEAYLQLAHLLRTEVKTPEAVDEAERVLAQITRDKPDDLAARLARCRYLTQIGRYADARADLAAAKADAKNVESNPDLALLVAELNIAEDKLKEAEAILAKTADANPKDSRPLMLLSEVYNRLNEFVKAKEALKKATLLLPDHGYALLEAIDRKIDYGMTGEARQDVKRFDNKEESRPAIDYLDGRILLAEGNWPAARGRLERAVGHFDRLPRFLAKAWVGIGVCHKAANNPDRMLAATAAAVKADPGNPFVRLAHAEANALLGRWQEAVPVFKEYADRAPEARVAYVRFVFAAEIAKPPAARNWLAFDAAVGKPPFPVDVVVLMARSHALRGQPETGVEGLREAAKGRPEDPDLRANLALAVGQKDPATGLAELDQAVRQVGDKVAIRLAKAQLLAADPATADYPAIAAIGENAAGFRREDRFMLYAGLGDVAGIRLGKPAEATEWYRRAAAEDPYHLLCRIALFRAALRANQSAAADQALKEIRDLDTADGSTYLLYDAVRQIPGLRGGARDKLPEVRAQVERAMTNRESWPLAHALLGELAELSDDPDSALDHYRRAFDLADRSDGLVRRMILLLCARSRFEEARRVLDAREQSGKLPPDLQRMDALVHSVLGGDPSKAATAAKSAANSKDPADQLFRGQTLLLLGDRAGAAEALEKAVGLNPGLIEGWVSLVRVYVWTGRAADAAAAAARADRALKPVEEKTPNKALVPTALGDIRLMTGRAKEAEGFYQQALKNAPADPAATRRLVELYLQTGRPADAVPALDAILVSAASDPVKRWARRAMADSLVLRPGGHNNLAAAIAVVDENMKSVRYAEDERARAFLIARDPFRRQEVRVFLHKAVLEVGCPAEDKAAFARLCVEEGNLSAAEDLLREATRIAAVARPDHLRALHRVQLAQQGRLPAARETLDRLKALGLATWEVASEEARHHAKAGDKATATKVALAFPASAEPAFRLNIVAPFLAEIGCTDDAEQLLAKLVETTTLPNRHFVQAMFYASGGKAVRAIDLAMKLDAKEYPAVMKARVVTTAVASRPRLAVPASELPAWDRTLDELAAWVGDQLRGQPQDRELLQCEAVVADARRRYDDAIRSYEARLAAAPDAPVVRNNLALLLALHKRDRSDRPLELIEGAIKQSGPLAHLLATRAVVHLTADRHAEAIRDLDAALLLEQRPTYYFHLALAYEQSRDRVRKIAALDRARELNLTKAMLHPTEWPEYERLFGPGA